MPIIWVVIVIMFSLINIINKANKQKQAQQQNAAKAQPVLKKAPAKPLAQDEKEARPAPSFAAQPAFHESRPLEAHMHVPQMGEEGEGTEGVDCCHEYMLSDTAAPEPADFLPMQAREQGEKAKALLQGVIFSEVLGRRPMKRYGGKRA